MVFVFRTFPQLMLFTENVGVVNVGFSDFIFLFVFSVLVFMLPENAPPPARACFAVDKLPKLGLVEMECIAVEKQ